MSKDWEPCPRCGSNKVTTLGKGAMFLIFIGSGGCLIWTGIIFPPMFFIAGALIIASPIGFVLPKMNQCKDCNKSWKAGHAKEYKKAIDDINKAKK